MQISLIAFNARFTHSCLGLFHVRNELEAHCPEARLTFFQLTINDSSYEILLRITATRPDYVFFSTYIWNSDLVERLIGDLKVCLPGCSCVIGGPQAAVVAGSLEEGACTIVTGPIEAVEPAFYRDLRMHSLQASYASSPVQKGAFRSPYRDSDFARHLRNRHIYYESSRGCPFCCTYCLSAGEKGSLHKDLSQVEAELDHILSHRPALLRFVDRTFNDQPERALAIWRFLVKLQTQTVCHFEISPDRFSEEMLAFLGGVPPGLFQFEIGIQSTNPETLKAVRRPMDIDKAHAVVARLAAPGNIHLHVDLILGLPCETRESFLRSFARVFSMGAQYIQMGVLKILPDTPLCQTAEENGYQSCRLPPYTVVATRWIDHATFSDLYWFSECVERFVNNRYFVTFWSYLRRREEDSVSFFEGLLSVCRGHSFFSLAATQELMCRMLLEVTARRNDARVVFDLLRFDWLRCGHRFLSECLRLPEDDEQASALKKRLFQALPESMAGIYDRGEKNQVCKRGLFAGFSERGLRELGFADQRGDGYLCFLPERETGLHGFSRVVRPACP
jgi:radical SAM superfamily enzyme